jgi:hypothetical protein
MRSRQARLSLVCLGRLTPNAPPVEKNSSFLGVSRIAVLSPQPTVPICSPVQALCPASNLLTASGQSAQADFVSPAPDFNPGNLAYRSAVFLCGMISKRASIPGEAERRVEVFYPLLPPDCW